MTDPKSNHEGVVCLRFFFGYVVFIILLVGAILYAGPVPQAWFGHDLFAIMEGGWKILHGSRPYIDFDTLMGPFTHLIMALGLAITGPTPRAFPVATVLTLLPLAFFCWRECSARMQPLTAFLTAAYLCLVWTGPSPLHFDFWETSYAMNYNRQSYTLLSLLAIVLLMPSRRNQRNNGVAIGLLLALILFFKITYFVAALILLLPLVFIVRYSASEIRKGLIAFSLIAIPTLMWLGGPAGIAAMWSTYASAAKAREPALVVYGIDLLGLELRGPLVITLLAVQCLVWLQRGRKDLQPITARRLPVNYLYIEAFIVLATASFAEMGGCPNAQIFDIPLLGAYNIILLDRMLRATPIVPALKIRFVYWLGIFCSGLIYVTLAVTPLVGIGWAVGERAYPENYPGDTVIDSPGFQDIKFVSDRGTGSYPPGVTYVTKINDGLNLIRKHAELAHARVGVLDFSDGLSLPLQRPSPPNMPLGFHYGVSLNETTYLPPEHIFKGCDVLMIPRYVDYDNRTVPCLLTVYRDYLDKHFTQIDQSRFWNLFVQK